MTGHGHVAGATDSARDRATRRAELAGTVGSRREAGWIVEHVERVLGLDGPAAVATAHALAARRAAGEPLQYVLGRWSFRTIDLDVDPRVLIPRPETEQVVEVALARLRWALARRPTAADPLVCCDLGTGSGAIALSLAAEAPPGAECLEVWATDRSLDALEVARSNRDRLAREGRLRTARVELAGGEWFDALPALLAGTLDLVVANPPYVAETEFERLDRTVRDYEPRGALVAGGGSRGRPGLADIEAILGTARQWLRPTGSAVVEIAPHQSESAADVARSAGFRAVAVEADLAGRPRMVVAEC